MSGTLVDEELVEGLKKAKKKPCNFALIGKGPKPLKLFVRSKQILDGETNKAKTEFGGNEVTSGVVTWDGTEYVFTALELPSATVKAVKDFISESADVKGVKARFEKVTTLPDGGVGGPPVDESLQAELAELSQLLKKLVGDSSPVLLQVPSIKDEVLRLAGEAKASLKKSPLVKEDLNQARATLGSLGSLLKSSVSPPTDLPPQLPPTTPPTIEPPTQTTPPQIKTPPQRPGPTLKPPTRPVTQTGTPPTGQTGTPPTGTGTPPKTFPGLKKPTLPPRLPGVYFRKNGAPLFTLSTGDKTPDQLEAEKYIEEHAEEIFGAPKDPGSSELDSWNDILTTKGVNDAETTGCGPSSKELNCSFCTIGALVGMTSSEMSVQRQKKAGVTNPDPKLQEMTMWGNPTGDPSLFDKAASDFTAQISPMKDLAKDYADSSGGKYELVDNLKLKDNGSGTLVPETFDEKQLIADMKKLPNGTRFSVYMKGTLPQESHWCYAEKRNDFIIFRDYQQSIQIPKGRTNDAFVTGPGVTVDQLPLGPAKGNKIFVEGSFFAIKPKV